MNEGVVVRLRPVVRFREFPFGTAGDPSMREFMGNEPGPSQAMVLDYLRAGHILAYPLGADLPDWFDRPNRANPLVGGKPLGGVTPMTDGAWLWPAGLIHFVEKYNVRLADEFLEHAARQGWQIDQEVVGRGSYDYDY